MSHNKIALLSAMLISANAISAKELPPHTPNKVLSKSEALHLSSLSSKQSDKNPSLLKQAKVKAFTGKTVGSHVRLRTQPDTESLVIRELQKNELLIVEGEKNGYYKVVPPENTKAYIFRSFVLDGIVEGNRVNVRLQPDLDAPVIGSLNSGTQVKGTVSKQNPKWLEIAPPKGVYFYVAKEFITYAGGVELKPLHDARQATVARLTEQAMISAKAEMNKPYEAIDFDSLEEQFSVILTDYRDFPSYTNRAAAKLSSLKEEYLQKKLSYLESKTASFPKNTHELRGTQSNYQTTSALKSQAQVPQITAETDAMKEWEPIEQTLFDQWVVSKRGKTIEDFYAEQASNATQLTGIVESFNDPIQNKPGDYIVRHNGMPIAYVYSTHVNLDSVLGKRVTLKAAPRPNNSFAFNAYYVFSIE